MKGHRVAYKIESKYDSELIELTDEFSHLDPLDYEDL